MLALGLGVTTAGCLKIPSEPAEEPGAQVGAPSSVADVLDRHVAAIGGEPAVRAVEQRTIEARMIFHPEDGCEEGDEGCMSEEQQGSFLFQNTTDGRLYRRSVLGQEVEERGFDGQRGWVMLGGQTLRVDNETEALISAEDAQLHWYFALEKRGIEATLLPPKEVERDGQTQVFDGLRWAQPKIGNVKELWFDRASGLLREEVSSEGEGERQQSQTVVYHDYRDVDGVLVPHRIEVINQLGDRKQTVEFVTQRVSHAPIEAEKFAIPELPPPEKKPDQLLAQLASVRAAAKDAPKDGSAQIELARTAFIAGHFDEAAQAARATLAIDPKEPEAMWVLARVQVMGGKYDEAARTIARARKAGVRDEVIAREMGWIHLRRREYAKLANDLDTAGNPTLAGRYRSFVGKPLVAEFDTKACEISLPLVTTEPLLVVDIQVGDQTVGAIVDTGAADLILTESLAQELDVTVRARSEVAPGLPDVGHGQLDRVALGGLSLSNIPVNVFDDASIADMSGDDEGHVRAVVGLAMLSDFQISVDPGAKTMTLVPGGSKCRSARQTRRKGASVPVWLHESHYLYVLARMNGAEGVYLINTGMRGADMTANQFAFAHAGVGAPPLQTGEAAMVQVGELAIGDAVEVDDLTAAWGYFQQSQSSDGFRLDGMLGLGVLGRQPFVLDYDDLRLYFPPASKGRDQAGE